MADDVLPRATPSAIDLPHSPDLADTFRASRFLVLHGLVPETIALRWKAECRRLLDTFGSDVTRSDATHTLSYRVVTGDILCAHHSELLYFYSSADTRRWIARVTGEPEIFLSRNIRSAININFLRRAGQSYRWHTDAAPYTLLLFLTTSSEYDGGAFQLVPPGASEVSIFPRAGTLVLMDGTRCRHRVAPLQRDHDRITVPMVFPAIADDSRPPGLDDYLYQSDNRDRR